MLGDKTNSPLSYSTCCADVNECDVGNGGCSQLCVNTDGNSYCRCNPGYVLDNDGKTCNGT